MTCYDIAVPLPDTAEDEGEFPVSIRCRYSFIHCRVDTLYVVILPT